MNNKIALITGVTGQLGSYLLDLLLEKEYIVYGISRRTSGDSTQRIKQHLSNKNFHLLCADLTDYCSIVNVFDKIAYNNYFIEVYNFGAQSDVKISFDQPALTWDVTAKGVLNILEAIKLFKHKANFKLFQASSSEMFGSSVNEQNGQNEDTPFKPCSPYAVAKLAAHNLVDVYKRSYNIPAFCGIIFNSESPRRGENFVTRKITKWAANYVVNPANRKPIFLGNLYSSRDWSHALDTVRAIYLIMQEKESKNYVISSGNCHTIMDFLKKTIENARKIADFDDNLDNLVKIDNFLFRPNEVKFLRGDSSKLRNDLGWKQEFSFDGLVEEMFLEDYKLAKQNNYESFKVI